MIGLLVVCWVAWLATIIVQGLNLWTITAAVGTILFSGRKIGYICKLSHLVTLEVVGGIITVAFQAMFHSFSWLEFLLVVVTRLVFLGVAIYDSRVFMYVTVKKRKETK